MTPEEILKYLRDIQLPEVPASAQIDAWAWQPFAVLGVLVVLVLLANWARRTRWRRQARQQLRAIPASAPAHEQWPALVALMQRVAAYRPSREPPPAVFRPPAHAGEAEAQDLRVHIQRMISG